MREYLFLKNKIQRQIDWNGQEFTFIHMGENPYHRPTEPEEITLKGVYHQSSSYEQKNSTDATIISSKPKPMILCLYEDGKDIQAQDTVSINGKDMIVSGVDNIQELNVALQISLEVNE